jgi:copper homeostasis protein
LVFGAARDGALDEAVLGRLLTRAAAHGLPATLHRAIDTVRAPVAAIDTAIALGFDRVLSSGGAPTAIDGLETLQAMRLRAGDAITVMAASGIDAQNVERLLAIGDLRLYAPDLRLDRGTGEVALPRRGALADERCGPGRRRKPCGQRERADACHDLAAVERHRGNSLVLGERP